MPDPVHLQLFPSSYNCLSWSADGELAVSAGEYVHILTPIPQTQTQQGKNDGGKSQGEWHISRFRANIFTSTEWPTLHPQDREAFSIGAEQSLSTVVGLAWSPPGLARHRRCVLGVLTSNLVLSFYECTGRPQQGKWSRVAVVNGALREWVASEMDTTETTEGKMLQKSMVRSFAWCPPLKAPVEPETGGYFVPDGASRWGVQVLEVTNDDNDVIFLRVQESSPFSFEVLTVASLRGEDSDNDDDPGSLLSSALRTRIKTLSVACGPWIPQDDERPGVYTVTSNMAVAYGKTLKTVKLDVELKRQEGYKTVAKSEENGAISKHIQGCRVTGPFQWIQMDDEVLLAAGAFTELVTISIPTPAYLGKRTKSKTQIRKWPFYEGTDETRHWEPISGIASDREGTLYISTNGGYGATKFLDGDEGTLSQAPWKDSFDSYCEQFDIDRDLGGMVTGRIWGLACHKGLLAVAFTMHPKDMVEYRTAAEERTIITFTQLYEDTNDEPTDLSPEALRAKREAVIDYILHCDKSQLSKKVIYAAACCAILDCQKEDLLAQSRTLLEWLASVTGIDLSEEISKCTPEPGTIEPKSPDDLSGPGKEIFEQCDICDAGIRWHSVTEAQCANGHLFVRCGLTFLAIQEPGISKFCADCGTEYLGAEFVNVSRGSDLCTTYQMLCDAFDLCIYCGGKFQP